MNTILPARSQIILLRFLAAMRTRMFKYPLSYLIYSEAFDALQPVLRNEVCQQLRQILDGENQASEYSHLTNDLRQQIREIVLATKPDILQ